MGTSLTGNNISASYLGLLKSTDSLAIGGTKKIITDGAGNDLPFGISTSSLTFNAGAVDVPTLSIGTINEGFYQPTDETLGVTINGSEVARFNSTGLGIGVSPASGFKLTTSDQSWIKGGLLVGGTNGNRTNGSTLVIDGGGDSSVNLRFILNSTGHATSDGGQIIFSNSGALSLRSMESDGSNYGINLQQKGGSTILFAEATNKNVGINTLSPSSKLTISGGDILLDNSNKLLWGNTSDVYIAGTTSADNIQLGVGGSTQFTFAQTTGMRLHQYGSGSITGTVTQRLGVTSTGQVVEIPIGAGALDGSGTAGKLAKFTDSDTLGDSIMSESGSTIEIAGGSGNGQLNLTRTSGATLFHQAQASVGVVGTSTNHRLDLKTNSTTALTISTSQRVGIGTTSPSNKLHIHTSDNSSYIRFTSNLASTGFRIGLDNDNINIENEDGGSIKLKTSVGEKMDINNDGIGIGTNLNNLYNSNTNNFVIRDSGSGGMTISTGATSSGFYAFNNGEDAIIEGLIQYNHSDNSMRFRTNSVDDRLIISSSGDATFAGDMSIVKDVPSFDFVDTNSNSDFRLRNNNGAFEIFDTTNSTTPLSVSSSSDATFAGNVTINKPANPTSLQIGSSLADDPFLVFQSDGNTMAMGIDRSDSNKFKISDNATLGTNDRLSIDTSGNATFAGDVTVSGGNLGVGLTASSYAVEIETSGNNGLKVNTGVSGAEQLYMGNTGGEASIGLLSNHNLQIIQNGSIAIAIDTSKNATFAGSVTVDALELDYNTSYYNQDKTISAYSASNYVYVNGTGGTDGLGLRLMSEGAGTNQIGLENTNDHIFFQTNSSERVRIDSSGNVGIGTSSPSSSYKLDVFGGSTSIQVGNSSGTGRFGADGSSTKVGSSSNHPLVFLSNNTERIRIDSSGNLLVGSTTFNAGSFGGSAKGINVAGVQPLILLHETDTDKDGYIGISGSTMFMQTADAIPIRFGTSDAERMRIDSSGNVGIGTTSPSTNLHISSATDTIARITSADGSTAVLDLGDVSDPDGGRIFYDSGSNLGFTTQSIERLRLDSSGNVGIGTSSPSVLLDARLSTTTGKVAELHNSVGYGIGFTVESDGGVNTINSESNQALAFATNGASNERLRITSDGDVAIGGTSTTVRLQVSKGAIHKQLRVHRDVNGDNTTMGSILFAGDDSDGNVTDYARIHALSESDNAGSEDGALIFSTLLNSSFNEIMRITSDGDIRTSSNSHTPYIQLVNSGRTAGSPGYTFNNDFNTGMFQPSGSADTIAFSTAGSERLRITSAGLVGIGVTNPSYDLQIGTYGTDADSTLALASATDGTGTIRFGDGSSGTEANAGRITYNHSSNAMIFDTNGGTERLRIDSSGNFLVGTTNTDPTFNRVDGVVISTNDAVLCRSGASWDIGRNSTSGTHITFYTDNGSARVTAGNIASSGSTTSFNTTSDYRLKEDLKDFNALEIASKIKMYDFKWNLNNTRDYGVIAHELQEVFPQAVVGEKDGENMQGVDYSKLVPILLKSIQELEARVKELEKEI